MAGEPLREGQMRPGFFGDFKGGVVSVWNNYGVLGELCKGDIMGGAISVWNKYVMMLHSYLSSGETKHRVQLHP